MEQVYCLSPRYRYTGFGCTAFFLVVGVTSTLVAYFNVDGSFPHPKRTAAFFAILWSTFCLLGFWLIAFSYRYRLYVTPQLIEQVGVFSRQRVAWHEIQSFAWRRYPACGSVKLSGLFGTMSIDLGNISPASRVELVTFLRAKVPESRQANWIVFHAQHVQPPAAKQHATRRARYVLSFFFIFSGLAFFGAWWAGLGVSNLVASPLNILFGIYLLRKLRRARSTEADTPRPQLPRCDADYWGLESEQPAALPSDRSNE